MFNLEEKVNYELTTPNFFEIAKIEENEIRISNFWAWLLEPYQNHGLGDGFLKEFIRKAVGEDISVRNKTVKVEREYFFKIKKDEKQDKNNFIDLVLSFENDKNKTYIIGIEHKVNSSEGKNQTLRYRKGLENYSKTTKDTQEVIGIYFTKWNFPVELSDKNFKHIKYSDFNSYFSQIKLENLPIDSHIIISHFKRAILEKDRLKYDYFIKKYNEFHSFYKDVVKIKSKDKNNEIHHITLKEEDDRILFKDRTMTYKNYEKAFTYYFCYTIAHHFIFDYIKNSDDYEIYSDLGKSSSSGKSLYQLTRSNWNFEVKDRKYTIHIEGENPKNLNLHFERSPYIAHKKLKDSALIENDSIRNSLRKKFDENFIYKSEFLTPKKVKELSILSFKIEEINNFQKFTSEITKLIKKCDEIIQPFLSKYK